MTGEERDELISWICVIGLVSAVFYIAPRIPVAPGHPWPNETQWLEREAHRAAADAFCKIDHFEAPAAERCADTQWLVSTAAPGEYTCAQALQILERGCS